MRHILSRVRRQTLHCGGATTDALKKRQPRPRLTTTLCTRSTAMASCPHWWRCLASATGRSIMRVRLSRPSITTMNSARLPRSTRPSLLGTFSRHSVHHRFARPSKRCLQQLPGRLHVRQRPPAGQAALWIVLSREPGQLRFHLEFLLGHTGGPLHYRCTSLLLSCGCPPIRTRKACLSPPILFRLSTCLLFVFCSCSLCLVSSTHRHSPWLSSSCARMCS